MKPRKPHPPQPQPAPVKSDWELALEGKSLESAKPYSMRAEFALDDLIVHSVFGHGVVTALQPDHKLEVLFKNGYKVLIHGQHG